ncbi:phage head morphogenesis protein [Cellulosilyticum sp. I15G10I2]|uniref:phage head morphogenesis protein n=1 Tax=Cellulosilyticum sp. I15G10I2 TaxID=1892843 RepID=UPI00085C1BBD|nr:phage minor head protein [Cellulosilyticum sp. I15G10I2]
MDKDLFNLLYGNLNFEEAEKYFQGKLPLTKEEYKQLSEGYKQLAFTISNYTSVEIVNQFYNEVLKAIENGTTIQVFKSEIDTFLAKKGYEGVGNFQADNIFRTNLQTAYNVGHYEQMAVPEVMKLRPYWQYYAVDDEDTRPTHRAMDGMVYPADHEVWDTWYPPNGYKCRCTVRSLSKRQVEAKELEIRSEMPPLVPDEGFHTNPAKKAFEPDIDKYPEPLKKAYIRMQEK